MILNALCTALFLLLLTAMSSGAGHDPASLTYELSTVRDQHLYTAGCSTQDTKEGQSVDRSETPVAIELREAGRSQASAGRATRGKTQVTLKDKVTMLAARGYFSPAAGGLLVVGFHDDHVLNPGSLTCHLVFVDKEVPLKVHRATLPARRWQLTVTAATLNAVARRAGAPDRDPHLVLQVLPPAGEKLPPAIHTGQAQAPENVLLFLQPEPEPSASRTPAGAEDVTLFIWRRLPDGAIRLTLHTPEGSQVAEAAENGSLDVKVCFGDGSGASCFLLRSSSPPGGAGSGGWLAWLPVGGAVVAGVVIVVVVVVVVVVCCVRKRRARRLLRRSASSTAAGLNPEAANELNRLSEERAKAKGSFAHGGEEEAQRLCNVRTETEMVDLNDSRERAAEEAEVEEEEQGAVPEVLLPRSMAVEDPLGHDIASSKLVV